MHNCSECGQACYCDGDDTYLEDNSGCIHECGPEADTDERTETKVTHFETSRERRLTTCIFFNGLQNKVCVSGILYDGVRDASATPYKWPCLDAGLQCEFRKYPTEADLDEEDAQIKTRLYGVAATRQAILIATEGKVGVEGKIPCAICKIGTVSFEVAMNGHVHAKCSTANCVHWME